MTPDSTPPYPDYPIVFFDGVCGLCNASIDTLMRVDKKHRFRVAPLQGETAADLIPEHASRMESIVLFHQGRVHEKSAAVMRIAHLLGGLWHLVGVFWPVQWLVGDPIYNWVAKHRYKWFGKHETCRMPTPEERAVFLP